VLRIITGAHRGRKLETAPGNTLRPTAERVREAIFNKLTHGLLTNSGAPLTDVHVLDVFAGTGALGFEALSRGALRVTFFENDAATARLIKRNAEHLSAANTVTVIRRDATKPGPASDPASLVLMDAPYRSGITAAALGALQQGGWIGDGAIVVVEVARDEDLDPPSRFEVVDDRRYGAARIIFLRAAPASDAN
jgi:16S rRNA (guanine966-N2)-methyltransferase